MSILTGYDDRLVIICPQYPRTYRYGEPAWKHWHPLLCKNGKVYTSSKRRQYFTETGPVGNPDRGVEITYNGLCLGIVIVRFCLAFGEKMVLKEVSIEKMPTLPDGCSSYPLTVMITNGAGAHSNNCSAYEVLNTEEAHLIIAGHPSEKKSGAPLTGI